MQAIEIPKRWIFEINVSARYMIGGPGEPFDKTVAFVAPRVDGQRTAIDGREFVISQDEALRRNNDRASYCLLTVDASCVFGEVIDDVIAASETIVDSVAIMSSAASRVDSIVGWLADPWPAGATEMGCITVAPRHFPRYRSTATIVTLRDPAIFSLPPDLSALSDKLRAAMRWYAKSMETDSDVDQFAFLWIAAEIVAPLIRPDLEKSPMKTACGHFIRECPECAKSILKTPQGDIMRAILEQSGIDSKSAASMWRTRQMFHGANHLTYRSTRTLPSEITLLRQAVQKILLDLYAQQYGPICSLSPSSNLDVKAGLIAVVEVTANHVSLWEELGLRV